MQSLLIGKETVHAPVNPSTPKYFLVPHQNHSRPHPSKIRNPVIQRLNSQTILMSAPTQDQSITIVWQGKPITWRPRDPIPPPPTAETLASLLAPLQPVPPHQRDTTEKKKFKFKEKAKRGLKKLLPRMTKQRGPTKVLVTGVDTWSTNKHSLMNRLKFWKPGHPRNSESMCESCRACARKARVEPDARKQSHAEAELRTNPLRMHSIDQERASYDSVEIMIAPSLTSIPRSKPIPIPSKTKAFRGRGCCSSRGQNQQDGNVGAVKYASSLNAYSVSGDSIVRISIEKNPVLPECHSTKSENLFPRDVQVSNLRRESLSIDTENVGDLETSPERPQYTGPSPDILRVHDEMDRPVSCEITCPPSLDLEAELKEAMESSLPKPETVLDINETVLSPDVSAPETVKHLGESYETSLTESFGQTRSSLSSIDGHSAPSHSFHIEKPYSQLGSDFVDVEEYLIDPSASFPLPPYPALDSSAATEDFGFRPTCECMPGSWPGDGPPDPRKCEEFTTTAIRLLTPDLGEAQGFIMRKEEVMKELKQELPPQTDTSLSFWKCRPVLGPLEQNFTSPSASTPSIDPDSRKTFHLRGGGDEARFSLFRSVGKGKLVGNLERGKQLLNEEVSGSYMVGGWGRNETWKEFFVRMEKRVERRKELEKNDAEIEKLKAEKKGDKSEETEGL
jgi:hypothetical protein